MPSTVRCGSKNAHQKLVPHAQASSLQDFKLTKPPFFINCLWDSVMQQKIDKVPDSSAGTTNSQFTDSPSLPFPLPHCLSPSEPLCTLNKPQARLRIACLPFPLIPPAHAPASGQPDLPQKQMQGESILVPSQARKKLQDLPAACSFLEALVPTDWSHNVTRCIPPQPHLLILSSLCQT